MSLTGMPVAKKRAPRHARGSAVIRRMGTFPSQQSRASGARWCKVAALGGLGEPVPHDSSASTLLSDDVTSDPVVFVRG